MPEGPTIKVTAEKLRAALLHCRIKRFSCRYKKAAAEEWAEKIKEERKARVVLETDHSVAVLFSAPICELVRAEELSAHKTSELGPDLLGDEFDLAEAARRFFDPIHAERQVGDLVMDQTVLAGIGNILKSEILFQAGVHPVRPAHQLSLHEFEHIVDLSRHYMRRAYETDGFEQAFMPDELRQSTGQWGYVYRRSKKPCLRCGTPIQMARQGAGKRMTFFCPQCQQLPNDG